MNIQIKYASQSFESDLPSEEIKISTVWANRNTALVSIKGGTFRRPVYISVTNKYEARKLAYELLSAAEELDQ